MKTRFLKLSISLFSLLLFVQCGKDADKFNVIPHLEWRGYEIEVIGDPSDNRRNIILKVYFTDRDGDIGLRQSEIPTDSCNTTNYSLFIKYFEKVGNSYEEVLPPDTCQPFHNHLPYLTPEGQNKVLEGDINTAFSYLAFPKNLGVDSVKFELYIKDRSNHISNIAYSPAIFIPR